MNKLSLALILIKVNAKGKRKLEANYLGQRRLKERRAKAN